MPMNVNLKRICRCQARCFICNISLKELIAHLHATQTNIIKGALTRTGARGPITSVYVRDLDLNLIELARYEE